MNREVFAAIFEGYSAYRDEAERIRKIGRAR